MQWGGLLGLKHAEINIATLEYTLPITEATNLSRAFTLLLAFTMTFGLIAYQESSPLVTLTLTKSDEKGRTCTDSRLNSRQLPASSSSRSDGRSFLWPSLILSSCFSSHCLAIFYFNGWNIKTLSWHRRIKVADFILTPKKLRRRSQLSAHMLRTPQMTDWISRHVVATSKSVISESSLSNIDWCFSVQVIKISDSLKSRKAIFLFPQSPSFLSRKWDLVVWDESTI